MIVSEWKRRDVIADVEQPIAVCVVHVIASALFEINENVDGSRLLRTKLDFLQLSDCSYLYFI